MFTGIVEELGEVTEVEQLEDASRFRLRGPVVTEGAKHGDSIAVNGVCLTVVETADGEFTADVMRETLDRSSLGALAKGSFFSPTIFAEVKPDARIAQEEIFGPVTSVIPVDSWDEAVRVVNGVKYGLSSSLFTNDIGLAFRSIRDFDTGLGYVNHGTIGAEAHLPFGGVKQTGNGHREGGWQVYEFYSETKVCYTDYSGTLQRAQIDNYEG